MSNRNTVLGSLIAAGALCLASMGWAQSVVVSKPSGNPGDTVQITVSLRSGGQSIAGTQNDLTFDPANAPIAAKTNGKPDCAANTAIGKEGTTFAFQPASCSGAACTAIRVLVFSFSNTDLIPDGSVLYTCNVAIPAGAAAGTYALAVPPASVSLSDASGVAITPVTSTDGSVTVLGSAPPATPTAQPTPSGPAIIVAQVNATPGDTVAVAVTLFSGGAAVAGTQNDIDFDAVNAPIAAKTNGKPDCTANTDIGKEGTTFAFQPASCSGTACTGVRVLVFSFSNTDVIPDGSVLYTCNVAVSATAAAGIYTLTVPPSSVSLSDASGLAIAGTGVDGSVYVGGGGPTATPTIASPATPTAQPTPSGPAIIVAQVNATPGETVAVAVTLFSGGAAVAGTQNDIDFAVNAPIAAKTNGKPDCTANTDIGKEGTTFAFQPASCSGTACTGVRVLVFSFSNTDVIPDGSVLYTCNVAVSASAAAGIFTLSVPASSVSLSDASGLAIAGTGVDGSVYVTTVGPPAPSATATQTSMATPTLTAAPPTATRTVTMTATPTATKTPGVPTFTPSGVLPLDEDGCQIGSRGTGHTASLLLLSAVGLLAMRRRRR